MSDDIVYRLRKRAEIRRQISTRKSVQEGQPDRLADLLDEAAKEIMTMRWQRTCSVLKLEELIEGIKNDGLYYE